MHLQQLFSVAVEEFQVELLAGRRGGGFGVEERAWQGAAVVPQGGVFFRGRGLRSVVWTAFQGQKEREREMKIRAKIMAKQKSS